jgi:hypothetical protein
MSLLSVSVLLLLLLMRRHRRRLVVVVVLCLRGRADRLSIVEDGIERVPRGCLHGRL